MSWVGIDVGSTGCKAVAFDDGGRELAQAYREYPVLSPREGWAEIDSRRVSHLCLEVVAEVARKTGRDPVRGLCVSSQGEAFTPVGEDGGILGNAMLSFDTRAAGIAESWSGKFGRKRLYRITGHTAHPMFSLFKLLWLKKNSPRVWSRARKFLCFEDLVHHELGLDPAMSWPMAGRTMLFDVIKHDWDDRILKAAGIARDRLSRTVASGTIVGEIPSASARALGLRPGVPVVAGGHDQTCAALGVGITSPGRGMYATGTTECICPAFSQARFSDELFSSNLCTYDYTVKGMYTTVAFSLTGGNILQWFRNEFGREEVKEAARKRISPYELILKQLPAEPTRLLVLPYFTPSGTPYFDTRTPGAILGLRMATTRGQVLRALVEGVAFEMRLNMEILDRAGCRINELLATGGGARNRAWTQLKADVMGKPITTVRASQAGCLGAAMLARSAVTGRPLRRIADEMVRLGGVVHPHPKRAAFYRDRFSAYRQLYPALRTLSPLGRG
jgi:xylulokinase